MTNGSIRLIRKTGSALLTAGCLFLLPLFTASPAYAGTAVVKQGVYIDGVALGGMTREEAAEAINAHVAELTGAQVTVTIGDHTEQVPVSTFGIEWSNREILDEIMALGTGGNIISRYKDEKDIEHDSRNFDLTFAANDEMISAYAESLKQYDTEPENAVIYTTDDLTPGVEGGNDGITVDVEGSVDVINEAFSAWDGKSGISLELPVERVKPDVPYEELAVVCDVLGRRRRTIPPPAGAGRSMWRTAAV